MSNPLAGALGPLTAEELKLLRCELLERGMLPSSLHGRLLDDRLQTAWAYLVQLTPRGAQILQIRVFSRGNKPSLAQVAEDLGVSVASVSAMARQSIALLGYSLNPQRIESLYLPPPIVGRLSRIRFRTVDDLTMRSRLDLLARGLQREEVEHIAQQLALVGKALYGETVATGVGGGRLELGTSMAGESARPLANKN